MERKRRRRAGEQDMKLQPLLLCVLGPAAAGAALDGLFRAFGDSHVLALCAAVLLAGIALVACAATLCASATRLISLSLLILFALASIVLGAIVALFASRVLPGLVGQPAVFGVAVGALSGIIAAYNIVSTRKTLRLPAPRGD